MLDKDNVIDNKKVILKDELIKILPHTKSASIAVGYFFISGLAVIIQSLREVEKIRLLISNTTDKDTAEALAQGFHSIEELHAQVQKINFVNEERENDVISDSKVNTQRSLEYMAQTSDDRNVVEKLIEMMKTGRLEVRVYPKEKLHAKAYIFEPKDQNFVQGVGIVGSSNLSVAGVSYNSELNLKTYNSPDVIQLLRWFDDLWEEGLEFSQDFDIILKKSWAGNAYSPRSLFLRAAYLEYKEKLEGGHEIDPIWKSKFPNLFQFQKHAVDQCLTMFELYGGMIIGDVVGLGKTYVGTALLKYLQLQEYRPLIICPPTLQPMWEKFCVDYEVDAKILSRGKLTQEDFDLYRDYLYKDRDLVLIDESHHFRNNDSRQYENMYQFTRARDAKVILLTATPYSNNANDIKNQIMLFHQSEKTSIPPANETDLNVYFRKVEKGEANLVDLLRNIMVRRTRRYVLKQWGKMDEEGRQYMQAGDQRKYFPQRRMKTEYYDINKVYQKKYDHVVDLLGKDHLTFARYSLGLYVKPEYKANTPYGDLSGVGKKLAGLIRILLLKRMESSLEAFKTSIQHYVDTHKVFLNLLENGIIPIGDLSYKAMYDIAKSDPDSIEDIETIEKFKKMAEGDIKYKFDAFQMDALTKDVRGDIETFEAINREISEIVWDTDDKLQQLQTLLDGYGGRKVIIFTEFATTAEYLDKRIEWAGRKMRVDSLLGNSIEAARLFDPNNNPSNDRKLQNPEEVSLLITTDVLSEGVNLQAGEIIINYDFHWNPTRLIQRAGRVDRIGSKNEHVMVHNFLPDPKIEEKLKLEAIVNRKINDIQRIIGEDYKILKEDEQINTNDVYAIYSGDESVLDREENDFLEPTRFETLLRNIQLSDVELWNEIRNTPYGIRSSDGTVGGGKLFLACEIGTGQSGRIRKYYVIGHNGHVKEISSQEMLMSLESDDETTHQLPDGYDMMVAAGWKKFSEDADQIKASDGTVTLSMSQKWIRKKLMEIGMDQKFIKKKQEIEALLKAYSIPILKGKLNRELLRIRKASMDDEAILRNLEQLYLDYELQNQVSQRDKEIKSPRILYSRYVGVKHG